MKKQLTVIGCRAGSPANNSPASGYVLQVNDTKLLLDCGPGVILGLTMRQLINEIDAVIITHRHADHCADLTAFAYHRLFPTARSPLPLFGPPDLQHILTGLDDLFGIPSLPELSSPISAAFAFTPVTPGQAFKVAGLQVKTLLRQHPVPTMALHFTEMSFVYASDGALTDELIAFAANTQVLLAEATYPLADGHNLQEHGHMTGQLVGQLAQQAGVRQLVLTHLADLAEVEITRQQAAAVFTGMLTMAEPGLQVDWP